MARVGHGNFLRLFRDHRKPVEGALPFNRKWAHRLMTVAGNGCLAESNVQHAGHLPTNIDTLVLLAQLPPKQLEEAIDEGRVTAATTRKGQRPK